MVPLTILPTLRATHRRIGGDGNYYSGTRSLSRNVRHAVGAIEVLGVPSHRGNDEHSQSEDHERNAVVHPNQAERTALIQARRHGFS